jgi:hypothetical protein
MKGDFEMAKYRKKPIIIDAEVYRPGLEDGFNTYSIGGQFTGYFDKNGALPKNNRIPAIKTLEGVMEISEGDYIITGVKGERYPCKPDIFHATYELVED